MKRVSVRKFVRRTALIAFALVATLIFLEGAIRLYSAVWFPRMMQLDLVLGWKHAPNARKVFTNEFGERSEVRQNLHGHRGSACPLARIPGKYRVLVLGDSFTEGVQVGEDDVFTALLEKAHPQLEVLNAGVGGFGTVQEYLYLESAGLKHNANLVLLMVFENDLSDCLSAYPGFGPRPYATRNGQIVEIVRKPDAAEFLKYSLPVPFATVFNEHSYLFYFANTYVYHRLRAPWMRELQMADLKRANQCDRYEIMFGMLERFSEILKPEGIRFALVLIPTREQARQGVAPALQPIIDFCEGRQLPCLSMLERYARESDKAQPYFPVDIHWTKAGHRIAAEEISNFLRKLKVIPY